jgi:nitrogen fixation protein NifB
MICRFCAQHTPSCRSNLPGTSKEVQSPIKALNHLSVQRNLLGSNAIVGISGPGEPLQNPETFETLHLVKKHFPSHPFCLCTNGLLLKDSVAELNELGLSVISMTITGIESKIVSNLQTSIRMGTVSFIGETAAKKLIEAQLSGLKEAAKAGLFVKVNTIVAKGINDHHLPILAKKLADSGAGIMNIVPVIPPFMGSALLPPSQSELDDKRSECERYIRQSKFCKQCRSDASGIPGDRLGIL